MFYKLCCFMQRMMTGSGSVHALRKARKMIAISDQGLLQMRPEQRRHLHLGRHAENL